MIIAIQMSLTKLTDKIRQSRFYSVMTDKEHPVTTKSSVFVFNVDKNVFFMSVSESLRVSESLPNIVQSIVGRII